MSIPVVDEVVAGVMGYGHEIRGYPGLYPTHEVGIDVKGILKVFPVKGKLKENKEGDTVAGGGGGGGLSLGSLLGGAGDSFEIPFMYNPTQFTESKRITFATAPSLNPSAVRVFMGGEAKQIKMELFADASWGGTAGVLAGRLFGLAPPEVQQVGSIVAEGASMLGVLRPTVGHYCNLWKACVLDREAQHDEVVFDHIKDALDSKEIAVMTVPPYCFLALGPYIEMQCTVTDVSIVYEMFDDMMNPIRAKISVTFEEIFGSDYGRDVGSSADWDFLVPHSGYGLRGLQRRNSLK